MTIILNGSTGVTYPDGSLSFPALTYAVGTTTLAPLNLQSGTNLTTAAAGAMEYDGNKLMFTPVGTQRGIVPGMQFYRLNTGYAFTAGTTVAPVYGVGVTLSSSTVYAFEGLFAVYRAASNSGTSSIGFGGTATINNILYQAHSVFDPGTIPLVDSNNNMTISNTTSMTAFTVGASVNTITAFVTGTVSVNAGGTFIPQYSQTFNSNPATTQIGSYFRIYPIGASGSNTSVGTWA